MLLPWRKHTTGRDTSRDEVSVFTTWAEEIKVAKGEKLE